MNKTIEFETGLEEWNLGSGKDGSSPQETTWRWKLENKEVASGNFTVDSKLCTLWGLCWASLSFPFWRSAGSISTSGGTSSVSGGGGGGSCAPPARPARSPLARALPVCVCVCVRSAQRERHLLVPARPPRRPPRRAPTAVPAGAAQRASKAPRSPSSRGTPAACKSAWLRVTCQCPRQRLRKKRASFLLPPPYCIFLNLIFIPTFYSRSVSTFSVAFLSYSFFFLSFFCFCFFFLLFFSSHFFDYCLYLGKLTSMVLSLFLNQVFLACNGSLDKALCLGVRRSGARCERLPSPAKCATGFMKKALWIMVPIFSLCKDKKACF